MADTPKVDQNQNKASAYGKIPTRADILKQQLSRRKFFDSGDYALSKANTSNKPCEVGSEHPAPENIPHREAVLAHLKSSPVRRGSCLGPSRS